jgi:hypothetical protein
LDNETMVTIGLKISFDYNARTVAFSNGEDEQVLPLGGGFTITAYSGGAERCSPAACANCSLNCG